MNSQHYTASFSVAQSPAAVFAAVTDDQRRFNKADGEQAFPSLAPRSGRSVTHPCGGRRRAKLS